jgi:DNA-binding protein H-NS
MARTANTQAQIAKLKKQLDALLKKENAIKSKTHEKTLAQIVKLAKDNAIAAKDIEAAMGSTKAKKATKTKAVGVKKSALKGAKVAPKYRNPSNHEQTWTGRGVSPIWVQALKVEGKLDSALIVQVAEAVPTDQAAH